MFSLTAPEGSVEQFLLTTSNVPLVMIFSLLASKTYAQFKNNLLKTKILEFALSITEFAHFRKMSVLNLILKNTVLVKKCICQCQSNSTTVLPNNNLCDCNQNENNVYIQ